MNYSKVTQAIAPLVELRKMKLPYEKARLVYKLHKTLESEFAFFRQEEIKLINECAEKDEQGKPKVSESGVVTFESIEMKNKYLDEVHKLLDTEIDSEIPQIVITAEDMGSQMLSSEIIEKLEDIISFE